MDDGRVLYVLDAYHGIFSLDTVTLEAHHLFNAKTQWPSNQGPHLDPAVTRPLLLLNDLDFGSDGSTVYFTDSSWKWTRAEHPIEVGTTSDVIIPGRLRIPPPVFL